MSVKGVIVLVTDAMYAHCEIFRNSIQRVARLTYPSRDTWLAKEFWIKYREVA